jgi:hypothetical protein
MFSSSIARLTRQLTTTHVSSASRLAGGVFPNGSVKTGLPALSCQNFATNRKVIDAKNVKRLKIQAKKKKNVSNQVRQPIDCVLTSVLICAHKEGSHRCLTTHF